MKDNNRLLVLPEPTILPKVFAPDFTEESRLLKDCGALNFIDASVINPKLQTFVDVNTESIEGNASIDLSGLSDDELSATCENRYFDTNEINESILNEYERSKKDD